MYPKMTSPKELAKATGSSVHSIRNMINKMSQRYLLGEEQTATNTCFFFADQRDKTKTLAMVQSRIDELGRDK